MRVLVTGAAGFIGFHVAAAMLARGHDVVGADNLNTYYDPALKAARLTALGRPENFRFARVDVDDAAALEAALDGFAPDLVIHLAAQPGIRQAPGGPARCAETDIRSQLNMLELVRRLEGRARLIYASSSAVYGERSDGPFRETDRCDHPVSIYAAAKRSCELLAESYASLHGLSLSGLRFFSVYGPWGRPDTACWAFTDAILRGQPIRLFNGGGMQRDLTEIRDAVDAIMRVAHAPARPGHRIYNVGASDPVSLPRLVAAIEAATGRKAATQTAPMQAGDIATTHADISRLAADTGYAPSITVEKGVAEFVRWYRDYAGL
jgi:UDP-glucuronate 4-epimerase